MLLVAAIGHRELIESDEYERLVLVMKLQCNVLYFTREMCNSNLGLSCEDVDPGYVMSRMKSVKSGL